jgi:hypothetical protein
MIKKLFFILFVVESLYSMQEKESTYRMVSSSKSKESKGTFNKIGIFYNSLNTKFGSPLQATKETFSFILKGLCSFGVINYNLYFQSDHSLKLKLVHEGKFCIIDEEDFDALNDLQNEKDEKEKTEKSSLFYKVPCCFNYTKLKFLMLIAFSILSIIYKDKIINCCSYDFIVNLLEKTTIQSKFIIWLYYPFILYLLTQLASLFNQNEEFKYVSVKAFDRVDNGDYSIFFW